MRLLRNPAWVRHLRNSCQLLRSRSWSCASARAWNCAVRRVSDTPPVSRSLPRRML